MIRKKAVCMAAMMVSVVFLVVGCGPKPNPALISKMNNYFSVHSDKTYKGSAKFSPMPLAVGQFVICGNTESNGKRSVTRTAIVGKEGSGWILEAYTINDHSESCSQVLVTGLDKIYTPRGFENLDIIWVKIKDENGRIQTIEGAPLAMAKAFYKKALQSFDVSAITNTSQRVDVTVPAGTFNHAHPADAEVRVMGMTFRSKSWFHDKVPVNGMVKSVTDDGKMTTELLSFGTSGAKPCF